jgi:hypothetical protein
LEIRINKQQRMAAKVACGHARIVADKKRPAEAGLGKYS